MDHLIKFKQTCLQKGKTILALPTEIIRVHRLVKGSCSREYIVWHGLLYFSVLLNSRLGVAYITLLRENIQ